MTTEILYLKKSSAPHTHNVPLSTENYISFKVEQLVKQIHHFFKKTEQQSVQVWQITKTSAQALGQNRAVQQFRVFRQRHLTVKISTHIVKIFITFLKASRSESLSFIKEGYVFIKLLRKGIGYQTKGSFFIKLTHLWENGAYEGIKSISKRILFVKNSIEFISEASWFYTRLGLAEHFTPVPKFALDICQNLDPTLSLVKFSLKTFAVYITYKQWNAFEAQESPELRNEKNWKFRMAVVEFTGEFAKKTLQFTCIATGFPTVAEHLEYGVTFCSIACASYGWFKSYEPTPLAP